MSASAVISRGYGSGSAGLVISRGYVATVSVPGKLCGAVTVRAALENGAIDFATALNGTIDVDPTLNGTVSLRRCD